MMKAAIPMWIIGAAFTFLGVVTYAGFGWLLTQHTNTTLGTYFDVIRLAPKIANITISLP